MSRYASLFTALFLLSLWFGCSSGSSSSGAGGNGGMGGKDTGCPADKGIFAPPMGACSKEGDDCLFGDTSCVSVYVCTDGGWQNEGCTTGSSSSSSGQGGAGGDAG